MHSNEIPINPPQSPFEKGGNKIPLCPPLEKGENRGKNLEKGENKGGFCN